MMSHFSLYGFILILALSISLAFPAKNHGSHAEGSAVDTGLISPAMKAKTIQARLKALGFHFQIEAFGDVNGIVKLTDVCKALECRATDFEAFTDGAPKPRLAIEYLVPASADRSYRLYGKLFYCTIWCEGDITKLPLDARVVWCCVFVWPDGNGPTK